MLREFIAASCELDAFVASGYGRVRGEALASWLSVRASPGHFSRMRLERRLEQWDGAVFIPDELRHVAAVA